MRLKAIDGLPVIDARRDIVLEITPRDCSFSDPKKPNSCAAARAIKRSHIGLEARVHVTRIYIRANKGNWQRFMTPDSLKYEIVAFDRGGEMMPGEYLLRAPKGKERLGATRSPKKVRYKNPKRKSRGYHRITNVRTGPA